VIIQPFTPATLSYNLVADKLLHFVDVVQRKSFHNITANVLFLCQFFRGQEVYPLLLMGLYLKGARLITHDPLF